MYEGGLYYTEEEIKRFKEIFSLIATPIEEFAKKYNLFVEKYYYGCPKWTLFFVRSIGGVAQIYIDYLSDTTYDFIAGVIWGVDEYESETHHAKYTQIGNYKYDNNNSIELSALLEKSLQTIKNWKFEDLDVHQGGVLWKQFGRTEKWLEDDIKRKGYPVLDI